MAELLTNSSITGSATGWTFSGTGGRPGLRRRFRYNIGPDNNINQTASQVFSAISGDSIDVSATLVAGGPGGATHTIQSSSETAREMQSTQRPVLLPIRPAALESRSRKASRPLHRAQAPRQLRLQIPTLQSTWPIQISSSMTSRLFKNQPYDLPVYCVWGSN